MAGTVAIVVPCFNEAARLEPLALVELARLVDGVVLVVDDGSTDGTAELARTCARGHPDRLDVLQLTDNVGKGEATRAGLLAALDRGADVVGYCDADLSTPPNEMAKLVDVLREDPVLAAVLGSRVALLGHRIERRAVRHYLGRVFATGASIVLRLAVYDTQCGAKVFRRGPELRIALATPFVSRWAFDVELLGRMLRAGVHQDRLREVPLMEWRDVAGSKLRLTSRVVAVIDLVRIRRRLQLPDRRAPDR